MANKLFVGGLDFSVTNKQLEELFSQIGKVVSATVIVDRFSGKSKGFGFIEMSSDKEVTEAIKAYNGYNLEGRSITVNPARPMESREKNFNNDRSFKKRW